MKSRGTTQFWTRGEPMVWAAGSTLAVTLSMIAVLIAVVAYNGMGVFWPHAVILLETADGAKTLGIRLRSETNPDNGVESVQLKTANRELDPQRMDFHWFEGIKIKSETSPVEVFVVERLENGDLYGFLRDVRTPSFEKDSPDAATLPGLQEALQKVRREQADRIDPIKKELAALGYRLQQIHYRLLRVAYEKKCAVANDSKVDTTSWDEKIARLDAEQEEIKKRSDVFVEEQGEKDAALAKNVAVFSDASGKEISVPLGSIVRAYQPNGMSLFGKIAHYGVKIVELLTAEPRESNTEGGLFPAIFGTVMLVFLMAVACFPLGVLAGIYLGEYAKEGSLVRLVRIAVNNLAGIPSIVYGIFGLGFFIYGIGATLDAWLYPERVDAGIPTFGTGGILWASLTLGLLTIPVVIVATEESLRAIPRGVRESSLALGATKFQTLVRVMIPLASPGMMTGFILAMARAAGEVAPLMITGVVKLAPDLPLDAHFPFFHLDRKFMHLGFHIYDVGFQSPNVEASTPMVYVTTLLLLCIVLLLSSTAIILRNRMRKRYQSKSI